MEKEQEPQFIRPNEFAKLASISRQAVYEAIWRGDIRAKKVSPRIWLIDRQELVRWASPDNSFTEQAS